MELQIIQHNQFGAIRVIVVNGKVLFAGKDVATALGFKKTNDAVRKHVQAQDRRIVRPSQVRQNGAVEIPNAGMVFINESGLYSLILSSKLPTAREFQHWVTSEVLPSIRANGYYINTTAPLNSGFTPRECVEVLLKLLDSTDSPAVKDHIIKLIILNLSPEYKINE